ncbi:NAD(P)H:quinone oxidoreductase [Aliiglaciecola sp. CAU 1673]|uniref:NAD(P)H:quinone oxidoreductase n=1 Tax=Aliiglaciecola sp. CAU 1673 TaxID=3032595 RepID=UPI0023DC18A0|nr:NAD(P)H:quinone oxidoreductase [Aliiglaciecola sp. CAU 1673]MDF2177562.1 NAD(P)H:quinone oxidoreductase [Aliiglaciecola sp. CAU 1673]
MAYVLVLYYSRGGSTRNLAYKIAQGIEESGLEARLRTVAPVSDHIGQAQPAVPNDGDPYVSEEDLRHCCALAFGSPTRFGNMCSAMKYFWDSTSNLWLQGALTGKPACVFTSTGSLHGGQESTLLSMMLPLLHHGMLILGVPYSVPEVNSTHSGGGPYGASHVAGLQDNPALEHDEQRICLALGRRLANIAKNLEKQ